jgi:predicted bacteriocin transport accessory protein
MRNVRVFFVISIVLSAFAISACLFSLHEYRHRTDELRYFSGISLSELDELYLTEAGTRGITAYIYIGRPTCPNCQKAITAVRDFAERTQTEISYFNTTNDRIENREEMLRVLGRFGVEVVPALVHVKDGAVARIFDYENIMSEL